jgi:hypothetical protein
MSLTKGQEHCKTMEITTKQFPLTEQVSMFAQLVLLTTFFKLYIYSDVHREVDRDMWFLLMVLQELEAMPLDSFMTLEYVSNGTLFPT